MKKLGRILLIVLGVFAAVVAVFLLVAFFQPSHFSISRSTTIAAPPKTVFAHVQDMHKLQQWSPWAKMDPDIKITYSGPTSGVGSSYHWVGNSQVGEGSMTVVQTTLPNDIKMKLNFIKPFAANNDVDFNFVPSDKGTNVTWTMSGENGLIGKAMCLVFNMDKMVGPDFEKGLANLKSISEKESKKS